MLGRIRALKEHYDKAAAASYTASRCSATENASHQSRSTEYDQVVSAVQEMTGGEARRNVMIVGADS